MMGLAKHAYKDLGWKLRSIEGYGHMTCVQFYVLREMVKCKQNGWNFIDLSDVNGRTVEALESRRYIFASKGKDGIRYSVTSRGESACRVFERPTEKRRQDGICPRCNTNPRRRTRSGYLHNYCTSCGQQVVKRTYIYGDPDNPGKCPKCGVRKRQVFSSGRISSYCKSCTMAIQFHRQV